MRCARCYDVYVYRRADRTNRRCAFWQIKPNRNEVVAKLSLEANAIGYMKVSSEIVSCLILGAFCLSIFPGELNWSWEIYPWYAISTYVF